MRLREETVYKPKPMVDIGDKPILWHIMNIYAHHGFNKFVLCLGYKGEYIKEYFSNYRMMNNDFKVVLGQRKRIEILSNKDEDFEVILSDTGQDSMTGARVSRIRKYIDEDNFMLTYGDGVGNIDIKKLVEFHKSHGKIGTLTGVTFLSRFGELAVEGDRVTGFYEKPDHCDDFINGGFFIFKREFFDYLDDDKNLVLEKKPLENLAKDGQLMVYKHCGFWHAMDTMRDKNALDNLWNEGKAPWKIWED